MRNLELLLFALILASLFILSSCTGKAGTRGGGISEDHPRIWLSDARLIDLRVRADADDPTYTTVKNWVNTHPGFVASWSDGYPMSAQALVNFAIVSKVEDETSYCDLAIDKMEDFMALPEPDAWTVDDNTYPIRYFMPAASLIFDWCYDEMDSGERTNYINHITQWADSLQQGIANPTSSFTPWAHHDSANNYWYGYMWALTAAAVSMYGHSTNAEVWLDYVKTEMLPDALNQVNGDLLNYPLELASAASAHRYYGESQGGEWSEGGAYGGVNTEMLAQVLFTLKYSNSYDQFNETNFFEEYLKFVMYNKPPTYEMFIDAGDDGADSISGGKFRVHMIFGMSTALEKDPSSTIVRYAKNWFDEYVTSNTQDYKMFQNFIWFPYGLTSSNYNVLPDYYFAPGLKVQTYRSNWSDSALWWYSRFNHNAAGHTNDGAGHFSIWKNGWLIKDSIHLEYPGAEGENNLHHNLVHFPFANNRYMIWGDTEILHRENADNYIYYAGDASDIFIKSRTEGDRPACTADLSQRSFFYIKDNYLVVYDRARTLQASNQKIWQAYFDAAPDISGNPASYYNGTSKVFVKTLLPEDPSIYTSSASDDIKMNVEYKTDQAYNNFLHAIEVKDGDVSMSDSALIESKTGNMVGAQIGNYIVMFSEDNTEVTDTSYDVPAGDYTHFVTGLKTGASFDVSAPGLIGIEFQASDEGVIKFTSSGSGTVTINEIIP